MLFKKKLDYGAEMIANTIKPNVAIIMDVTHDNTPLVNNKIHGDIKCGEGPTVTYAPSVHNKFWTSSLMLLKRRKFHSKDQLQADPQEPILMLLPTVMVEFHPFDFTTFEIYAYDS